VRRLEARGAIRFLRAARRCDIVLSRKFSALAISPSIDSREHDAP
jgi:hypothetical protein